MRYLTFLIANELNFCLFAVIDSIGRPTSGILEGRLTYLGRYDECIDSTGASFAGKYCIAHIQLPSNISDILSVIISYMVHGVTL